MIDLAPNPSPPPPNRFAWDWALAWTGVFAANLPVPLWGAESLVREAGKVGLVGGLAVLYWVGFVLCLWRFRVSRSLVWGGLIVAMWQPFPIIQFACGILALAVWESLSGHSLSTLIAKSSPTTGVDVLWQNVGVFAVVLLTAQPMWVIAILIGAGIRALRRDRPIWYTPRTGPDADAS